MITSRKDSYTEWDTLDLIFWSSNDGAERLLWHMILLDIQELPEVTPAQVEAHADWRTR